MCSLLTEHIFQRQITVSSFKEAEDALKDHTSNLSFLQSSEILKNHLKEKKLWIMHEIVKTVQPKLTVNESRLIFRSDAWNTDLSRILLDEFVHDVILICRTKRDVVFGAYIEQISKSIHESYPVVIFSLENETKYPKVTKKDKKYRPLYINEQKILIFGMSEMKITPNLQVMHTNSNQGYYGLMKQN